MDVSLLIGLIGGIIFLGFFSLLFFERTKIPNVLILILLGMLLGPLLKVFDPLYFIPLAPFVGALALIIILLDGGMNLNLFKVIKEFPKAALFTLFAFVLTTVFTMGLMHFAFGWTLLEGLLLGVVLGGPCSTIVVPIVSKLSLKDEAKTILNIEAAITDALCIVIAITLIQLIASNTLELSAPFRGIASAFSIAAVLAVAVGVFWMNILKGFHGRPFGYLLTLAVVFILYAVVESVGGNGAISILAFGLVLGNYAELAKLLKAEGDFTLDTSIKAFQTEVSFFVKTFFFVYLGVIFNLSETSTKLFLMSFGVLLAIFLARLFSVKALSFFDSSLKDSETLLATMMPRGLAAAVLAAMPLNSGIKIGFFIEVVLLVIILTNIVSTVGAYVYERKRVRHEKVAPGPRVLGQRDSNLKEKK